MKRALGTLVRKTDAPEAGEDTTARGLRELKRLTRRSVREQEQTQEELRSLREDVTGLRSELQQMREAVMAGLQVAVDDESHVRRLLDQVRAAPGYDDPWDRPDPLVSVVIPTYSNWRLLRDRSIPSALAQTHPHVEVVVVGDTAPQETADVVAGFDDPRLRYENLAIRGPYPEDDQGRWFVAGTGPMNRAVQLARGSWVAFLNDDDALRPEHVSTLLEHARERRSEVAYSKMLVHFPDDAPTQEFGLFPPVKGAFGWQIAMQHRDMRMFEFELAAAVFDEPGDWHRARRMLRAGVRFSQADAVTCDYFPNHMWKHR